MTFIMSGAVVGGETGGAVEAKPREADAKGKKADKKVRGFSPVPCTYLLCWHVFRGVLIVESVAWYSSEVWCVQLLLVTVN